MNEQKSLLIYLGEALDRYRAARRKTAQEQASPKRPGRLRTLLPTPGNVLFTLLVVAGLLWANSVGALPLRAPAAASTSTGTIAYQGRLADADGTPITNTVNMIFRLYDVATGGVPLWEEQWTGSNGVQVSDGLFNVMLGSLTPIPQSVITGHDSLFLGITVGTDDEMTPRVQLGTVPFAVQALTVPDGSITTAKIEDGAVTEAKLDPSISLEPPDGSITTEKIADGAAISRKVALTAKRAYSTSPQSFNQATYTPINDMSISFTADEIPVDSTLIIDFACTVAGGPWMRSILYRVYIDDEPVGGEFHSLLYPEADYRNQGSLTELVDVDAGAHTVKIYYRLRVAASEPVGHNRLLRVIVVSQ
ncbi:MAG: hypothetical protein FJ026_16125 [Chloroflexi bacterium]|nr:hypothetical protein [Chloroflexota bacterium]